MNELQSDPLCSTSLKTLVTYLEVSDMKVESHWLLRWFGAFR